MKRFIIYLLLATFSFASASAASLDNDRDKNKGNSKNTAMKMKPKKLSKTSGKMRNNRDKERKKHMADIKKSYKQNMRKSD